MEFTRVQFRSHREDLIVPSKSNQHAPVVRLNRRLIGRPYITKRFFYSVARSNFHRACRNSHLEKLFTVFRNLVVLHFKIVKKILVVKIISSYSNYTTDRERRIKPDE